MTKWLERRRHAGLTAAVAIVVVVLGACTSSTSGPSPSPAASPDLAGRTFLSTGVTDGGALFALVPGTRIRLAFTATDIGASAGCNTIGGQYRVEGDRLVFSGGAMTEMACQGGRDAQDSWLIGILSSRPTVTLKGNDLTIVSGTVTITLLDREVAEPDLPLTGRQWVVVGIVAGDVVSSVPAGVFATLQFDADGRVAVASGCNQGAGRWAVRDATLTITDLALTKKACLPPAGQVESAILGVLRAGAMTLQIDASSMTLTAGFGGLQLQVLGPD